MKSSFISEGSEMGEKESSGGKMVIREIVSGFFAPGVWDANRGFRKGRLQGIELVGHFEISIDDLDRFLDDPSHVATLWGSLSVGTLGEDLMLQGGVFNFTADPSAGRHMTYEGKFEALGRPYVFTGYKEMDDDDRIGDAVSDITTLLVTIREAEPSVGIFGAGIMHFHLRGMPGLFRSIQTPGASDDERVAMITKYFRFAYGSLADTFLAGVVRVD